MQNTRGTTEIVILLQFGAIDAHDPTYNTMQNTRGTNRVQQKSHFYYSFGRSMRTILCKTQCGTLAGQTAERSHHKVHQGELMSQRKGYHFNQTWRSTRCWKKSMKDDQPWRLNNRRNPRDGDYMEKVLNTDHITRGSSRLMQLAISKSICRTMRNIDKHYGKKRLSA